MEKDKKKIIAGATILGGAGLAYLLLSRKRPPQEGDTECVGFDLYQYHEGQWVLVETNSPTCDGQPPGPPGEWSEGVEVQEISAEPPIAYQGEVVDIKVVVWYGAYNPDAYPIPTTIFGTVKVNGEELTKEISITDSRIAIPHFQYIASQLGEFTATAQDKSANLTVVESPVGTYYSPFGGIRIPVCTELTIPDVDPFYDWRFDPNAHPGGDYIIEGRGAFYVRSRSGFVWIHKVPEIEERLDDAYPSAWDIGTVTDWSIHEYGEPGLMYEEYEDRVYVAARAFTNCPPYWSSKEELAQVIADTGIYHNPSEFAGYDVISGIAYWIKPIGWGTNPPIYTGIKHYNYTLACPYCSKGVELDHEQGKLALARVLLEHIENDHPDHPLIEPAWF